MLRLMAGRIATRALGVFRERYFFRERPDESLSERRTTEYANGPQPRGSLCFLLVVRNRDLYPSAFMQCVRRFSLFFVSLRTSLRAIAVIVLSILVTDGASSLFRRTETTQFRERDCVPRPCGFARRNNMLLLR